MPAVEITCPPGTTFAITDGIPTSGGAWVVSASCNGSSAAGAYYLAASGSAGGPDPETAAQMFGQGFGFVGIILLTGWACQQVLDFIFPDRSSRP